MRSMRHRVFVYGTLKSGFWKHYLLEAASGSRLTFESPEGIPRDLNACESGACEPESPLLLNLLIAAV